MNRHISQISGVLVIVIALTVLLGWQFDISLLKSGVPFINVNMKANTAICFLFAGISLMLLSHQPTQLQYRFSQGLAGAIVAIGLLTLSQYSFGWDLHIDQLLFRDVVSPETPYAGRMGISTAVNFVMIGAAIFLLGRNRPRRNMAAQIFSTVAALVSLLALLDHLFNINIFERLVIRTTIQALNTVFSFFILYIGILWLRPKEGLTKALNSPLVGGNMARRLLPWAITFPVFINWLSFHGQKFDWYSAEFGYTLSSSIMVVTFSILIWVAARVLNQIDDKRQKAQAELKRINKTLEKLVAERTEALEKSKARFAGILDIDNDAIISVDLDQKIVLFNQGAEKIFGYKDEDVLGQPLDLLLPEQCRDDHPQHIQQFVQSAGKAKAKGERGEILGRRQDGTEFPTEASISKLEIGDETIFTVILRDISDRKQIAIALQNSEEQFRHAFEDASIGMAIVSLDGHFLKANPMLCQIIGYSLEELLELSFRDITHPDDLEVDIQNFNQILAGAMSVYSQREKRYIHKQGHTVWVLLNASLIKDNQGNSLNFITHIQDITARKEAQKTLELQSIIMNNMAGGVCLVKAIDLMIVYTNPKFDAMFGYSEGELTGQPVGVINYVDTEVTPDASVEDIVTKLDRDGEAEYEVHNKKKDGTLFWCRVHTSKFDHPEYGTVYVAVQEDVTELKLSEKALRTTANRLDFLLNYSPVVIFSSKPDGDYGATFISENVKALLGYESKEFIEDSEFWLKHLHPEDTERVFNGLQNLFVNDFYFHEYRLLKSNGNYCWVLCQLRLIRDRAGHPIEILGYLLDISDRKQVELELQQAKETAEMANLAKSMFLSNMSHELRTPLNAILGFTELMSYDPSLSPENQEDLAIVNRSGKHLLALINDILDLSKIESGQMKLNLSDFELENLLTSIEELFQVQAQLKELQLIIERDANLPRFIHADEKKIYQVLVNLLGNAIKFTQQGSIILRVKQLGITASNKSQILFEVEDTGVGIAPTEIDTLFQVFVQAQAGSKFNQGTGLGLAISQKFVQLMGSQIHVHSRLDHGSVFSFELRVTLSHSVPLQANLVKQRVIGLASGQPKYRILIVEDLEENRCLLTKILTSVGFEVREATQGVEALALWESWSPHLIWMDLLMPVMDGYTTIKHIREHPHGRETIIIALTASVLADNEEKALIAGCNDFVGKPFQENHIFDKIAQHLGVQYIYANSEEKAQPQSIDAPSQEQLAMMPTQWLEQMYQAAYYLDSEAMNQLITQIPESNSGLSRSLTYAIANFNTDRVIDLIRPLLPKPSIL